MGLRKNKNNILPFEQTSEFYYKQGLRLTEKGNMFDALIYHRRAYEKEPLNIEYAVAYAWLLNDLSCFEDSCVVIYNIMDREDCPVEYSFLLGNNFMGLKDFNMASKCFGIYLEDDPYGEYSIEAEFALKLSEYFYTDGEKSRFNYSDYDLDLIESLNESAYLDAEPQSFISLARRGKRLLDMGEYEGAIASMKEALEKEDMRFVKNNLSLAYYFNGNTEAAVKVSQQILQQDENNLYALCNMAVFQKDNEAEKERLVGKILFLGAEEAEDLYKVATTLCELGYHQEARNYLYKLLRMEPYNKKILHYLAVSHYKTEGYKDAIEYWGRIEKIDHLNFIVPYYINLAGNAMREGAKDNISYYYQVPYKEMVRRIEIINSLHNDFQYGLYVKEGGINLLLWGLMLEKSTSKMCMDIIAQNIRGEDAVYMLRRYMMSKGEDSEKYRTMLFLKIIGAKEPYIANICGDSIDMSDIVLDCGNEEAASRLGIVVMLAETVEDVLTLRPCVELLSSVVSVTPELKIEEDAALWAASLETFITKGLAKDAANRYNVKPKDVDACIEIIDLALEKVMYYDETYRF